MSEYITVARPYAKAAFDFAYEHQCVERWQEMLFFIGQVSRVDKVADMISGSLAPETLSDHVIDICGEMLDEHGRNLIRIMAENGRLNVLPEVLQQFMQLKALQEGTVDVDVTSANKLTEQQLAKIAQAMEQRLSRKVKLNCTIDKSVIAGVIIQSGDMVIDGSIRGRLDRLTDALQS